MIHCRDLTVNRGGRVILDAVSFKMAVGEHWLLWGANGAGKTTLARTLAGFIEPDAGALERHAMLDPPLPLLFQDPDAQIAAATVRDEVALGARGADEPSIRTSEPGPAGRRLADALRRFELEPLAGRNPRSLSGGEKRRLNLASLSVLESPLLILDEPELHLDPNAWDNWTRLLDEWFAEGGRCLLEISRDPQRALGADGLAVLSEGRLIASGPPREVYDQLRGMGAVLPRVRDWEPAAHRAGEAAEPGNGNSAAPGSTRGAASRDKQPAILEARGLNLERPGGGAPVLRDLDLAVGPGERLLIVGENGGGKSSLLLLLAGLADPDGGVVNIRPGSEIGIAFQEPERLCFAETVADEVGFGLRRRGLSGDALKGKTDWALDLLGLDPATFGSRDPFSLSAGELRRVALASVLALAPDLLLLDEAGAALDGEGLALLHDALSDWPGALIWVDCRAPAGWSDIFGRTLRLAGGFLVEEEVYVV